MRIAKLDAVTIEGHLCPSPKDCINKKEFRSSVRERKLPHLYSRDRLVYEERLNWKERIRMFEKAYLLKGLFSLSIQPTHPEIWQDWYLKKTPLRKHRNLAIGFLKPFPLFFLPQFHPDPEMKKLAPIILRKEIFSENFAEIKPEPLREGIIEILTHFLHDPESTTLGMIYFQHQRPPAEQVVRQVFSKEIA